MRGREYILVTFVSLIFTISLMTAITPVKAAYVKVYVDQPLGYIPFAAPGDKVTINIMIETSGIADGTTDGIVAWGLDVRVDPNVLDIDLTAPPPPPFPPPPPPAQVIQGDFLPTYGSWYGLTANLLPGTSYPATGFWDDISEAFVPAPDHGAGDYTSGYYPLLVTLEVESKSDTQPCLIDLIDVEYKTADKVIHAAEIVQDGYYGGPEPPPRYMSYQGSLLPPGTDPVCTNWHEIYPQYCKMWHLADHTDNGDGELSASDQIDMVNETGWTYHFHVDQVTTTIHWTIKTGPEWPADSTGELAAAEPVENNLLDYPITDPIGTAWHQIYPPEDYCKEFVITSWNDNGDEVFSESDQFDFEYFGEGVVHWGHLDDITTDILLSQKGEPEPPVPEFPLGAAVEVGLIVAVAYIWWTRRRKLKEVP